MEEHSFNTWINKGTTESTSPTYKDGFVDMLEERRHTSDFQYVIRKKVDVPSYKYCQTRTPQEIMKHVIHSERVRYQIEKISRETKNSQEVVAAEAREILNEMAHNFSMSAIRCFGYAICKVFKALFNKIYVNQEGIQMLRQLIPEYPVLLMPTHRSYLDFLLVSFVFFEYDLPLPVIAAAMDFKGMKFFGTLLRSSGAYYIRRSFGTDELYWAVFTEYVQTQLRNGDAPMEFFIEGTRSRTAKSYKPRIGMLSAALESYFKAELPDVMMVPISISYDRIIEESLYAFEVLGIPKPKESATGVFKARKILSDNYGNVHFNIGQPISIRQFAVGKVDRVLHGLEPRYINNLALAESQLIKQLSHHIVCKQQNDLIVSPWSLMAAVLMQNKDGILLQDLVKEVDWLRLLALNLGTRVDWPGNTPAETVLRHYASHHENLISVDDLGLITVVKEKVVPSHVKAVKDNLFIDAATHLMLASYRNQVLHVFVRAAIIALAVNGCANDVMSLDELYTHYCFLEKLLSHDFIFELGHTQQDYDQALRILIHNGAVKRVGNNIHVKPSINKYTTFLSQMFEPFLVAYWVLCQYILLMTADLNGRTLAKKSNDLVKNVQSMAAEFIKEGVVKHHEIMSLNLLNNGISALIDMGLLHRDKRDENAYLAPNQVAVAKTVQHIVQFIEIPLKTFSDKSTEKSTSVITAKL